MSEAVLDVVSGDPQKEHVSEQVQKVGVEKHGGEERHEGVRRPRTLPFEGDQEPRLDHPLPLRVRREEEPPDEDDDVREDEKVVHEREGAPRIDVADRDDHSAPSPTGFQFDRIFGRLYTIAYVRSTQ